MFCYYVPVDLLSHEDETGRVDILLCGDGVLPVFTSLGSFWRFVDVYYAGEIARPGPLKQTPPELADTVEDLRAGGLRRLVFDPVAVSAGRWTSIAPPVPAGSYLRFIGAICPGAEKLSSEATSRFAGRRASPQTLLDLMRWSAPRVGKMLADVRALVEEWEVQDDS